MNFESIPTIFEYVATLWAGIIMFITPIVVIGVIIIVINERFENR